MKKIILLASLIFLANRVDAQNNTCAGASPFCSSSLYTFPANSDGTGPGQGPQGEPGPNYGCLQTTPNPAWYYMQVDQGGNINMTITANPAQDIDFIVWGPFPSLNGVCGQLTAANQVDCSYMAGAGAEFPDINNAQPGEFYIILLTNYANTPTNITFSQTGGNGSSDCSIIAGGVTNNGPLCTGDQLILTATTVPGATSYTWTGPNGFGSTTQNPVINNATTANAGVYMMIVTDGVTIDTAYTTVVINDYPVISLAYDDTICAGDAVLFTGSESTPAGQIDSYNFDLDNNGSYEYQTTTGDTTFSYFLIAGAYNIGFQVTTPAGCNTEGDFPVSVYANPTVNLLASPLEVCLGTVINLQAQVNLINPPSLPSVVNNYLWDYENNGSVDEQGPSLNGVQHVFSAPGSYQAEVTVTTSGGCTGQDVIDVVVNDLPRAGFTTENKCSGEIVALTDTTQIIPPDFINTYSWDVQNPSTGYGTTAGGPLPLFLLNDTGLYTAVLIVTSDKGCTDTVNSTFRVFPNPVANFSYITNCFGKNDFSDISTIYTTQHSNQWDFDEEPSTIEISDQYVFQYDFPDSSDKIVTLIVSDGNGCTGVTTQLVNVKGGINDPTMPNVFKHTSLVGNNKWDFNEFAPGFNDCIEYTIAIYNRWGAKVYETENTIENPDLNCSHCFTGMSNTGSVLSPGTYYYVLNGVGDEGNTKITKNGMITVLD